MAALTAPAGAAADIRAGDGQAQRGRLRRRQRARQPRRAARARRPRRRRGGGGSRRRDGAGAPDATVDAYLAKLDDAAAIVEERIVGDELRSPSVQIRVTRWARSRSSRPTTRCSAAPAGSATSAAGSRRPGVRAGYHARTPNGSATGWPRRGCWAGSRSTSWPCAEARQWDADAIEVNLRKGGTTHPFLTLQFLTDGRYDPATAASSPRAGRNAPGRDRPLRGPQPARASRRGPLRPAGPHRPELRPGPADGRGVPHAQCADVVRAGRDDRDRAHAGRCPGAVRHLRASPARGGQGGGDPSVAAYLIRILRARGPRRGAAPR